MNQEGGVADDLYIHPEHAVKGADSPGATDRADNAQTNAEHRTYRRQCQREAGARQQQVGVLEHRSEIELIGHGASVESKRSAI
ncbi:hypothetical protein SDC9_194688 [bioreactor metagenome]|uniref:Uncharacterized protein n=1 Tax=bioreactor metagenome TaxID=1076179 RepID=A0A645I753_9ZZZZ